MPQNYLFPYTEAARAEESIPSMTYATLLENLSRLTDLDILAPANPIGMLVAARIVDRSRIQRSGLSAMDLRGALEKYRQHPKAVFGIVKALEQAHAYLLT